VTYRRNTEAYEQCDLIPNVLAGVENIDMSTTVMGQKIDMPLYLAPTALQRLFHHEGEKAVGKAAENLGQCLVSLHLLQPVLKRFLI
jgi:L-lactate dehydrogenase (cytochrome)